MAANARSLEKFDPAFMRYQPGLVGILVLHYGYAEKSLGLNLVLVIA